MEEFDFDEYINEDTEIDLDDDYDPNELSDYIWHPSANDSYDVDFAYQALLRLARAYSYITRRLLCITDEGT